MKIERALKVRDAAKTRLADTISTALHFGPSSNDLERMRRDVVAAMPPKTPHWVKAYLDGYWRARIDEMYREHLVFGGKVNGRFHSTHRDRDDYYEKQGIAPSEFADNGRVYGRGHYWKFNLAPFFIEHA